MPFINYNNSPLKAPLIFGSLDILKVIMTVQF